MYSNLTGIFAKCAMDSNSLLFSKAAPEISHKGSVVHRTTFSTRLKEHVATSVQKRCIGI